MKKLAAMVLVALLCFSIAGCGGNQEKAEKVIVPDSAEKLFSGDDVYFEFDDNNKLTFYFLSDELEISDCFYTLSYAASKLGENDVNYQLSIVLPDGTYDLDLEADELDGIGFPDKWNDFFAKSGIFDGTQGAQDLVSKSMADTIENAVDEKIIKELEKEDNKYNVLTEETYKIGNDTFDFSFGEDKDGYKFYLMCEIENKSDAYITHILLNAIMNSDDKNMKIITEDFGFMYTIMVGDGSSLVRSKNVFMILGEDGKLTTADDYFPTEWIINEVDFESDYGEKVVGFLTDFIENK